MTSPLPTPSHETGFADVVKLIQAAHQQAYQSVNSTLLKLYWQLGQMISQKLQQAEWGDKVMEVT